MTEDGIAECRLPPQLYSRVSAGDDLRKEVVASQRSDKADPQLSKTGWIASLRNDG